MLTLILELISFVYIYPQNASKGLHLKEQSPKKHYMLTCVQKTCIKKKLRRTIVFSFRINCAHFDCLCLLQLCRDSLLPTSLPKIVRVISELALKQAVVWSPGIIFPIIINNFNVQTSYLLLNFKYTFHSKAYDVIMVDVVSKRLQKG